MEYCFCPQCQSDQPPPDASQTQIPFARQTQEGIICLRCMHQERSDSDITVYHQFTAYECPCCDSYMWSNEAEDTPSQISLFCDICGTTVAQKHDKIKLIKGYDDLSVADMQDKAKNAAVFHYRDSVIDRIRAEEDNNSSFGEVWEEELYNWISSNYFEGETSNSSK